MITNIKYQFTISEMFQISNMLISFGWSIMMGLGVFLDFPLNLPKKLIDNYILVLLIVIFILLLNWVYFIANNLNRKVLFKGASLIFGSLLQALIAGFYISDFPPFEPMLLVCGVLSLIFLVTVIFIFEVEGYNECACKSK